MLGETWGVVSGPVHQKSVQWGSGQCSVQITRVLPLNLGNACLRGPHRVPRGIVILGTSFGPLFPVK